MLRSAFILLSKSRLIPIVLRRVPGTGRMVGRFVPGETLASAVAAARALNRRGFTTSLDHLGESITEIARARRATAEYIRILEKIKETGLDANISVKLTQMGLKISRKEARANLLRVVKAAEEMENFVRIDMEDSSVTGATLDTFVSVFGKHRNVGVVIQAYLYRSEKDIGRLIGLGARVRLCKGAYKEPASIAYPLKKDVDASYIRLMERLMLEGNYPALATHDEKIVRHAVGFATKASIPKERFEFQMLYGIRTDLQNDLRKKGYNVRIYVPYGREWYPYFMRRLGERPANLVFLMRHLFG